MLEIIPWILVGIVLGMPVFIFVDLVLKRRPLPPSPIPPVLRERSDEIKIVEVPVMRPLGLTDDPEFPKLLRALEILPQKVVESVTNTSNHQKGKLGELIGYLHLNSQYDRLIVLRDITDFIGIRFPKGDDPGIIDFIDIKNGQYAKLTKEQTMLKKLAEQRLVGFQRFKVETDGNAATPSSET